MTSTPRAFLSGLIDYAGLFPPAALALHPAIHSYARDHSGSDGWMLSRFILPVSQLTPLNTHLSLFSDDAPVHLSVLGHAPASSGDAHSAPASSTDESWANRAMRTLVDARRFQEQSQGRAVCDRFELRLPVDLAADADALSHALGDLEGILRTRGRASLQSHAPSCMALEVPLLTDPDTVEPAVQAIADANGRATRPAFALKIRCGGVTADLFPPVESLARALDAARRAGVPFKATAGLHHPVRQYRDEVETEMFGFMNVFGGAILALRHGLDADALAEILADTDPSHFELAETLRWTSLSASPSEVAEARAAFALSYGSCSFDEPREDLRQLGWL